MVSTRRNTYNACVDKKQPPPRQVQKKLRDKLETASRELEKAYDRVDNLESEKAGEGDEDSPIQVQIAELKRELDAVKQQRDELQQNFLHTFTHGVNLLCASRRNVPRPGAAKLKKSSFLVGSFHIVID